VNPTRRPATRPSSAGADGAGFAEGGVDDDRPASGACVEKHPIGTVTASGASTVVTRTSVFSAKMQLSAGSGLPAPGEVHDHAVAAVQMMPRRWDYG